MNAQNRYSNKFKLTKREGKIHYRWNRFNSYIEQNGQLTDKEVMTFITTLRENDSPLRENVEDDDRFSFQELMDALKKVDESIFKGTHGFLQICRLTPSNSYILRNLKKKKKNFMGNFKKPSNIRETSENISKVG